MKKIITLFATLLGITINANAQIKLPKNVGSSKTITIDQMPTSTEDFIQLRDELAKTPEGAAALFIVATIKYSEDPKLGRHWVIMATDRNWLSPSEAPQAYVSILRSTC